MTRMLALFAKKILLGFLMIYSYNILVPSEAAIPLNIVTIILTSFLGMPGLALLIIIKLFIY